MELCSIGKLAVMLGVSIVTLRRWDRAGHLLATCRTIGGHRRYDLDKARSRFNPDAGAVRKTIAYARVSSHDQAEHLATQARRLTTHCIAKGHDNVELITDLGSGMNFRKKGLIRLVRPVLAGHVARIVLVTKDRLLRFGNELLFHICALLGVEIEMLDSVEAMPREQQLAEDLVEIITVFSSCLYGSRSRKNLRALTAVECHRK